MGSPYGADRNAPAGEMMCRAADKKQMSFWVDVSLPKMLADKLYSANTE